jgi:hypothetical protein
MNTLGPQTVRPETLTQTVTAISPLPTETPAAVDRMQNSPSKTLLGAIAPLPPSCDASIGLSFANRGGLLITGLTAPSTETEGLLPERLGAAADSDLAGRREPLPPLEQCTSYQAKANDDPINSFMVDPQISKTARKTDSSMPMADTLLEEALTAPMLTGIGLLPDSLRFGSDHDNSATAIPGFEQLPPLNEPPSEDALAEEFFNPDAALPLQHTELAPQQHTALTLTATPAPSVTTTRLAQNMLEQKIVPIAQLLPEGLETHEIPVLPPMPEVSNSTATTDKLLYQLQYLEAMPWKETR